MGHITQATHLQLPVGVANKDALGAGRHGHSNAVAGGCLIKSLHEAAQELQHILVVQMLARDQRLEQCVHLLLRQREREMRTWDNTITP